MADDRAIDPGIRRGLAWVGLASTVVTVIDVIAGLIVPAIVGSEALGVAAAAIWLFPIFDLLVDAGLANAIVRRPELDDDRLSTVFWTNLGLSLFAAAIIVIAAETLTGDPVAGAILTVYAGKLIFHNAYFVPQALLRREMRFRELAAIRISANVANTGIKLGTAIAGVGPWCFLFGNLAHAVITAVGVQLRRRWVPRLSFAPRAVAGDLRFGGLVALREMLFFFFTNVDYRVVIHHFGAAANGVYRFAFELVLDPVRTIALVVNEVALPAFVRLREDRARLVNQFVALARLNMVVVLPLIAWLAIGIDDVITLVPGWRDYAAVPSTVRLLAGVAVLRSLTLIIPPLLDALGLPGRALIYGVVSSLLLPGLYVGFAVWFGPALGHDAVALAWLAGYPLSFALLGWMALVAIDLRIRDFIRRTIGIPGCALIGALSAVLVHAALGGHGPGLRLAAMTVTLFTVTGVALARLEGLGPRRIIQLARGQP
jgi:O-antigen/teichoic acid export membrane protein